MKFPTKASLRYHTLKHKNERIYKCEFPGCHKSFITEFQLNQHKKAKNVHNKPRRPSFPDLRFIRRNSNPAMKINSLGNSIIMQEPSSEMKESRRSSASRDVKGDMGGGDSNVMEIMRTSGLSNVAEKNIQKIHYIIEENKYLKKHLDICKKIIAHYEKSLPPNSEES